MPLSPEQVARTNRAADAEKRPGDTGPSKPAATRRLILLAIAAFVVAIAALVGMFARNSSYDGTSPVPVEQRR